MVDKFQATASNMNLQQWLDYLLAQHPVEIDLGLARLNQVAQPNELHQLKSKVITVAGTNGKGSSCALLEQILLAAGFSVGVYSSPHLVDYRERVRINEKLLDEKEHCLAFESIEKLRGEVSLTYFEMGTLAALHLFKQHQPDFVILEVGLGGRFDATNIVDSDIALVTTIAHDHETWLGTDLEKVGYEKAGVFRRGKPAVIGDSNIVASVPKYALALDCDIHMAGRQFEVTIGPEYWSYSGQALQIDELAIGLLPIQNAASVLAVIECLDLNLSAELIRSAVANWRISGRMQTIAEHPKTIVDVAHNPQSAAYLASQLTKLKAQHPDANVLGVCAMLDDKDHAKSLEALSCVIHSWFISGLDAPRGDDGSKLNQALADLDKTKGNVLRFKDVTGAFDQATISAQQNDFVVVFGSFYTVAAIMEHV